MLRSAEKPPLTLAHVVVLPLRVLTRTVLKIRASECMLRCTEGFRVQLSACVCCSALHASGGGRAWVRIGLPVIAVEVAAIRMRVGLRFELCSHAICGLETLGA